MDINSNKIKVYPSAYRDSSKDPESRLYTEANITRPLQILCTHTDYPGSFVITKTYSTSSDFEFVIGGYYFKLDKSILSNLFSSSTETYYAYIVLEDIDVSDTTETNIYSKRLSNNLENNESLDIEDVFKGLIIATEDPDDFNFKLCLLKNNIIPEDSRVKFKLSESDLNIESTERLFKVETSNIKINKDASNILEVKIPDTECKICYTKDLENDEATLLLSNTKVISDNIIPENEDSTNIGTSEKKYSNLYVKYINTNELNISPTEILAGWWRGMEWEKNRYNDDVINFENKLTHSNISLGKNLYTDVSIIPQKANLDIGATTEIGRFGTGYFTNLRCSATLYGTMLDINSISSYNIKNTSSIETLILNASAGINTEHISTRDIEFPKYRIEDIESSKGLLIKDVDTEQSGYINLSNQKIGFCDRCNINFKPILYPIKEDTKNHEDKIMGAHPDGTGRLWFYYKPDEDGNKVMKTVVKKRDTSENLLKKSILSITNIYSYDSIIYDTRLYEDQYQCVISREQLSDLDTGQLSYPLPLTEKIDSTGFNPLNENLVPILSILDESSYGKSQFNIAIRRDSVLEVNNIIPSRSYEGDISTTPTTNCIGSYSQPFTSIYAENIYGTLTNTTYSRGLIHIGENIQYEFTPGVYIISLQDKNYTSVSYTTMLQKNVGDEWSYSNAWVPLNVPSYITNFMVKASSNYLYLEGDSIDNVLDNEGYVTEVKTKKLSLNFSNYFSDIKIYKLVNM